jgi:hypothetical protein
MSNKTILPHTTSDFSVEDEQKSAYKEYIRRVVARLNSPEGKASLAAAAEETRKRSAKLEQNCRITDPLFMLRRVTI